MHGSWNQEAELKVLPSAENWPLEFITTQRQPNGDTVWHTPQSVAVDMNQLWVCLQHAGRRIKSKLPASFYSPDKLPFGAPTFQAQGSLTNKVRDSPSLRL